MRRLTRFTKYDRVLAAVGLLLLIAAVAFRVKQTAHFMQKNEVTLTSPNDEGNYLRMAVQAAQGKTPTDDVCHAVSFRSPMFSMLFGTPVVWLSSSPADAIVPARWLIAGVGFLGCVFFALLGARLFEGRLAWIVGTIVLLLSLIDTFSMVAGSSFMAETPGAALFGVSLLLLGVLYRAERRRLGTAIAAGGVFAAAALVKFEYLYVIALLVAYSAACWFFTARARAPIVNLAVALAVFALLVGGYATRNALHTGHLFLSSKDATNLWIGNNPDATGHFMWRDDWPQCPPIADESALRAHYEHRFFDYVASEPGGFVRGLGRKLFMFVEKCGWQSMCGSQFHTVLQSRTRGRVLSFLLDGVFAIAMILFLLGRWGRSRRYELGLLAMAYVALTAVVVLVFVELRYLVVQLAITAIVVTAFLAERFRARPNAADPP